MSDQLPVLEDIVMVGLNHRAAPVEVREKLAFHPERLGASLQALHRHIELADTELVLLSTCNRTEIYVYSENQVQAQEKVFAYLANYAHLDPAELETFCTILGGSDAAHHLLRVSAGLDSLILGENEVLGQVRTAFASAQQASTVGLVLSALFRAALQAGKRVRSETELGSTGLSIATVVVELAEELLGPLNNHTALLIGAGKISAMTGRALTRAGLRCVLIANRSYEKAQKLADALGGQAVRFERMLESLSEADIVICSTGAPHIVLHADPVRKAMADRRQRPQLLQRPLLVTDLAVPRDADPQIAAIEGVRLIDIDDLDDRVRLRHPLAAAVRTRAEAIVCEEQECFQSWISGRRSAALICALQNQTSAIVEAQVRKTLRKMAGLSPEQQEAIEVMGKAIAGQFLHEPIQQLKNFPEHETNSETEAIIRAIFGLN